jgi:hypothetical protein
MKLLLSLAFAVAFISNCFGQAQFAGSYGGVFEPRRCKPGWVSAPGNFSFTVSPDGQVNGSFSNSYDEGAVYGSVDAKGRMVGYCVGDTVSLNFKGKLKLDGRGKANARSFCTFKITVYRQ